MCQGPESSNNVCSEMQHLLSLRFDVLLPPRGSHFCCRQISRNRASHRSFSATMAVSGKFTCASDAANAIHALRIICEVRTFDQRAEHAVAVANDGQPTKAARRNLFASPSF